MDTTESPAAPEPVRPARPGFFERLFGVLFSPTEAFAGMAGKTDIVRPLALLMVFSVLLGTVINDRVGPERIVQKQFEDNERMADMPAERRAEMMERMIPFIKYSMFLGPLLGIPLMSLVVSGLLLLMTNFVFGAEARYPAVLTATIWGFTPGCVAALLGIIVLFLKDPSDVDVQNIVAANLGILFDAKQHKVLHRLAFSLDLFSFWQMGLLATGAASAARISFKKGLAAVMTPWALWVLGAVAWTAVF